MPEQVILDPVEIFPDREELDLTPYIRKEGVDWGEAQPEYYWTDSPGGVGQIPIDFRIGNHEPTIPLMLKDHDGVTFAEIRAKVQAKVALWIARGGAIKRITRSGFVAYADVMGGGVRLSGGWEQAHIDVDNEGAISLRLLPDWYGEEIALDVMTGTGEIVGVLRQGGRTAEIQGSFPLGNRCRIVVTDTSGSAQLGMQSAFRGRYYAAARTAALTYAAETLAPADTARVVTLSGSYSGRGVQQILSSAWTPVLDLRLADGSALTHHGTYRVLARVRTSLAGATSSVAVRLLYSTADLVAPTEKPRWNVPSETLYYWADLGQVNLAADGASTWSGQIQGIAAIGGYETLAIDRVRLLPLDEFHALCAAPPREAAGLGNYLARDEFAALTLGTLNGQTLPNAQRWATFLDTDDFTTSSGAYWINRATTRDGPTGGPYTSGRLAVAGALTAGATLAEVDVIVPNVTGVFAGVVARVVDSRNYVVGGVWASDGSRPAEFRCATVVGGAVVSETAVLDTQVIDPMATYTIRIVVVDNRWSLYFGPARSTLRLVGSGIDPSLDSVLARGMAGFLDTHLGAGAAGRSYWRFDARAIPQDAVLYPFRSASLGTDAMTRDNAGGTDVARIPFHNGSYPRLPSGQVEVLAGVSRGDFDSIPDSALSGFRAQVLYRPCWLSVPD